MKTERRIGILAALALCLGWLALAPGPADAQTWPTRPIKFVVAYPPGGGADVTGRLFAEAMSKTLGERIIVENRSGAGGTIGANLVVHAEPDGYTILVAAISEISIAPATVKALPYDPTRDLQPVVLLSKWSQILVATPSFPANSLAELIAYAKQHPGALRYGSFGNNTLNHVNGERFKLAAGIDARHIPYRGSGPMLLDLLAGQIEYAFDGPATTLSQIAAGKLKAIAVAGDARLRNAPQIPTTAEAGLPDFQVNSWIGMLAPAQMPRAIVDRLNEAANAAMTTPEVIQALDLGNTLPGGGTPEAFGTQIRDEIGLYRKIVSDAGIEPQ
jgi:tripartite-type tricarboxylate transporter receptor subunit TctC